VEAIEAHADADADHAATFLDTLIGRQPTDPPLPLPAEFLLDLAAGLRLLLWEQAGLNPQAIAGLPPARQVLRQVLLSISNPWPEFPSAEPPGTLARRVLAAFVDHFAWTARVELDAEVVLSEPDEEAVLEALADFLWQHRPR
jgi:hypothetical protein